MVGAFARAARHIALTMQFEVGEAAEPAGPGRGGSSTMPHKRNPVGAALVVAERATFLLAQRMGKQQAASPAFVDRLLAALRR